MMITAPTTTVWYSVKLIEFRIIYCCAEVPDSCMDQVADSLVLDEEVL